VYRKAGITLNRAFIHIPGPYFKPADASGSDDDEITDIDQLLFGDAAPEEEPAKESEIDIDSLGGDDLDAALAALMAADDEESGVNQDIAEEAAVIEEVAEEPQSEEETAPISELDKATDEIDEMSELLNLDEGETDVPEDEPSSGADIDALLASLGGGDDSRSISGSAPVEPEADSAGGADIDALLASLGGADDSQSISGSAPVTDIDIDLPKELNAADDLLERMLAHDAEEDKSLELNKPKPTPATAVYDDDDEWGEYLYNPADGLDPDERRARREAEAAARRKAKNKKLPLKKRILAMPVKKLITAAAAVVILILATGGGIAFGIQQVYAERAERALAYARFTPIESPVNVANYSHFIQVDKIGYLRGREFFLRRVALGLRGTAFTFDEVFDPDDYTFILYDQDGNYFGRMRQDMDYTHGVRTNTTLMFSPVRNSTRELILVIQERGYQEVFSFYFLLENGPGFPAAVYLNNPVTLFEGGSNGAGGRIAIADAIFSNTGTEIVYMLYDDPEFGMITFDRQNLDLREGGRNTGVNMSEPIEYAFPRQNRVLGRKTFGPVRNLDSTVNINFSDLFISRPMPASHIDIFGLFRDTPEDEHVIPIGDHTLVLERMGTRGHFVLFILHGTDEAGNRVRTELEVDLTVETEGGPITISGRNFSIDIGTDVVFDTSDYGILSISPSDLSLDIQAVNMRIAEATASIQMDTHNFHMTETRQIAERSITNAFMSRLNYMAEIVDFGGVRGFSNEVLSNRALMRHYSLFTASEDMQPLFDARVLLGAFADDSTFLAVVEEEWVLENNGIFTTVYNKHLVEAELIGYDWIITHNRVID